MNTKPIIDILGVGLFAGVSFKTLDFVGKSMNGTFKEVGKMAYRKRKKGTRKKRRKTRKRRKR